MENVSIVIVDKSFNVQNLQGLVIRSEEYANKIKIQFPKTYEGEDLTGKIFILKCTNANGVYFETLLPKTITAEYIELLWTVTAEFTTVSGVLKIAIFAESANYSLGTTMSKVIVEESPQYSIPIDDFTVLESYMTEIRVAADEVERDRAETAVMKADFETKIVDNLASTDPQKILSANQGRVIDERINNIVGYAGTSAVEVVDARYSSVTGVTSPNLTTRLNSAESNIKELQNTAGAYGIRWNETDDVWTRLGQSTALTDFSKAYPFRDVRRCNLDDSGKVVAYYGDPTFKEDGTNGQVMVEYPKTYTKYSYYTVSGKTYHEWWVSRVQYADFEINPAFIKGTSIVDKFYIGAYNGSIFDTSASAYLLADEQVADFTVSTGDKLSSISGAKPCSGLTQDLTIIKSRILANNRGANWGLWNGNQVAFVQMLLMIEYGHANSQTAIGSGVVNKASGTGNESELTGATSFLGNLSGRQAGTDGLTSVSYRGLENMWGNIYSFVDGINIQADNKLWINTTNQNFVSDSFDSPYILQGTLSNVNGYVSKLLGTKYGMFATQNTGSSTTKIPDYYYQSTGNRIARLGGFWYFGSDAGFACWSLHISSVYRDRYIGARLCYA